MFEEKRMFHIIQKNWKLIGLIGIIFAGLTILISFLFHLQYRADAQVMIISKSRYGVDPYTVVKSAEQVGGNLVQVVKSNDFYNKVIAQPGFNLDKTIFDKLSEQDKRKLWQKNIIVSVVYGTGVLNVSAYHENKDQAKEYAGAVANTLVSQAWQYVGGDITLKVINDPVVTSWPVRPNLVVNALVAFMFGILLSTIIFVKRG